MGLTTNHNSAISRHPRQAHSIMREQDDTVNMTLKFIAGYAEIGQGNR